MNAHVSSCKCCLFSQVGRDNQYKNGQFLRQRYDKFLRETYHPDVVAVETTGVDRTIMSAQLQMAGMWPPVGEQQWNANLPWQPISMQIDPLKQDKVSQNDVL